MKKSLETTVTALATPLTHGAKQPLYATSPQAGFPSPGDDLVEATLNIHDLVVKHPASTFFVRVEGDSMVGAGIYSGDVLVVDRSVEANHGRIVVAVVDGGMVVKRVRVSSEGVMLVSENSTYEPIRLNPEADCYVWGVVVGSVRQF
jgi:DNA polymerase V